MEKERIYKSIHKILHVYEKESFENYQMCLSRKIIWLSQFNDDIIKENLGLLKGLKNMGKDISRNDVRSTILYAMNEIDRNYKGG